MTLKGWLSTDLFCLIILSLALHASEVPLSSSHKRPAEASLPTLLRPMKQQVFARPTYDATAKYLLSDPEIRLDFIQTFTGMPEITETEALDGSLNPLRTMTTARELFANQNYQRFMSWVKDKPEKFHVFEDKDEQTMGNELIRKLAACFDDIAGAFPRERDSKLDILCRLQNQDYVLVEIQVSKQDWWDERALAYAASVYGGQLRAGGKWRDLKKVIAINILGGGPQKVVYWKDQEQPVRHYQFQDKYDSGHVILALQLIQYSLGDANLAPGSELSKNKKLHDWIECLREAHEKEEIPSGIHEALRKAYDKIRFNSLPPETKEKYEGERHQFEDFTEYTALVEEKGIKKGLEQGKAEGLKVGIAQGIEQAKQEVARKLLAQGMEIALINQATGLSEEQIKKLQTEQALD